MTMTMDKEEKPKVIGYRQTNWMFVPMTLQPQFNSKELKPEPSQNWEDWVSAPRIIEIKYDT